MFTRDELLTIAMTTGNRAYDVRTLMASEEYKANDEVRHADGLYADNLEELSEKAHAMANEASV